MCYGHCSNEITCGPDSGECRLINPTKEDCEKNLIGEEREDA